MRRALLPTIALILTACGGNWSDADLQFAYALPDRQVLSAKLPTGSQARAALGAAPTSELYQATRGATQAFNQGLDGLLLLLEELFTRPPTVREENLRIWGPFPLGGDPRWLVRITIEREADPTSGNPVYRYAFDVGPSQTDGEPWTTGISGWFEVTSDAPLTQGAVRRGRGEAVLHAGDVEEAGLGEPTSELEALRVEYSTDDYPIRVAMDLVMQPDSLSTGASYLYEEQADRSGRMEFRVAAEAGWPGSYLTLWVTSQWLPTGEGRGDALVTSGLEVGAEFNECWDSGFGITWSRKTWIGVEVGSEAACAFPAP